MPEHSIIRTKDLGEKGAELVVNQGLQAIERGGRFRVALAGGKTPRPLYECIARDPLALDWENVIVTFTDERAHPPDHPESNYRMIKESLLAPIPIPAANILRIEGELEPAAAASRYESRLRQLAADTGEEIYKHDLVILGMGQDGHVASLFPSTQALDETGRWVIENRVPQLDAWRVTLTFPILNRARAILFVISDPARETIVQQVIDGTADHPASRIRPSDGTVTWLLGT